MKGTGSSKYGICLNYCNNAKGCVLKEAWISNDFYTTVDGDGIEKAPLSPCNRTRDNSSCGAWAWDCNFYVNKRMVRMHRKIGVGRPIYNKIDPKTFEMREETDGQGRVHTRWYSSIRSGL